MKYVVTMGLSLWLCGIARPDTHITVVPNLSGGVAQTFTVNYEYLGNEGPDYLMQAHFWILPAHMDFPRCYLMWQRDLNAGAPANSATSKNPAGGLYLANDADNILAFPPMQPGSSEQRSNSACTVFARTAKVTRTEHDLIFEFPIQFRETWKGEMTLYASAYDRNNVDQGFRAIGKYIVVSQQGAPAQMPKIGPSGALTITEEDPPTIDINTAVSPRVEAANKFTGVQTFLGGYILQTREPRPECKEATRGFFLFERDVSVARYKRLLWWRKRAESATADQVHVCTLSHGAYIWATL